MANFGKFGNLSTEGWDSKTATQSIRLGQSAHIGLWGGGPSGEVLEVSCLDGTVCVAHEEPTPRQPHWRHFLLTALRDGQTEVQARVPSTSAVYARMTVQVVGKHGVRLVFFPGERSSGDRLLGTIYVIGGQGEKIPAAGGPAVAGKIPKQGGHTFEPTPAGIYTLGPKIHVIAPGWTASAIPWGATLRINTDGEVEYQDDSGRGGWHLVTGPKGIVTLAHFNFQRRSGIRITMTDAIAAMRNALIDPATRKLRWSTWEFNDFGRWGWNLRRGRNATAYFVHTTPDDEATTAQGRVVFLANSHGCIHVKPTNRDDFIAKGYLKEGIEFEVRPYSETGPP